ncbi:COG1361 S-layer family protein [Tautonia marina]|uniref:COG1361 S-layer family protein n=1 Tax=Tautonia marina TaxID=2653855 RepID=UPI0012604B18|nr:DUF11 domain-containing protein [Tautonia marina]
MPLRMSIAAVISLGLAVGVQFVSGQAAQQPPQVAQPPAPKPSAADDARLEPPRVASPAAIANSDAPAASEVTPPRVVEPDSNAARGSLPQLPVDSADIGPPAVASPRSLDLPPSDGMGELLPPSVADQPAMAIDQEQETPPAPPDLADAMPFDLGGVAPDLPSHEPPDEPNPGLNAPIVPATVQFEELPSFESEPASASTDFVGGQQSLGSELPSDAPGIEFSELAAPPGVPQDSPAAPGFADAMPTPEPIESPELDSAPVFEVPNDPPADLGPPTDDPVFAGATPEPQDAPPAPAEAPVFDSPAPMQVEAPPAPASNGSLIGRSPTDPPSFSSTEPPADPSIRTSAAPQDGVGAMSQSLGDRFSEGPREIGLNLDVAMPQTSNINLPMKAVITLRNDGRDDAFDVVVRLPLPDGLEFLESSPQPDEQADDGRMLVWKWSSLGPSDTRSIDLTVKPLKAVPMDLVPRVMSVMAAKSRTTVQEPRLKIDLVGPNDDQVKGSEIDFSITVRNNGTGPARQVNLIATLTGGLKGYDHNGQLSDAPRFEQMIGDLAPGEVFGPVVLTVLADSKGMQNCTIEALSPDVVPATPVSAKPVNIVVPELVLDVIGPESRPVGSVAEYTVTITNQGTRYASDVAVALFAPESGVPDVPQDAKYRQDPDKRLHSIYWRIPRLDKGESREFRVPIRLDRIALYTVEAAAHCEGFREGRDTKRSQKTTEVMGIPDVKIVDVTRKDTVIDAGDTTEFEIRIKNIGSKEATNVFIDFYTNEWISVEGTDPPNARTSDENPYHHGFDPIDRLAPGADRTFIVTVKAQKPGPAIANFDVHVYWEGIPDTAAVRSNNHVRIAEGQIARSDSNAPK